MGQVDDCSASASGVCATGAPAGGWLPAQKLSRFEALRGFTADAAYAAFDEGNLGTIRVRLGAAATLARASILGWSVRGLIRLNGAMIVCFVFDRWARSRTLSCWTATSSAAQRTIYSTPS